MPRSSSPFVSALVVVGLGCLAGCDKKPEARPDDVPARPSPSIVASASIAPSTSASNVATAAPVTSGSASPGLTTYACDDGSFQAITPGDETFGYGGLGLVGTGSGGGSAEAGVGEGIGLGTVGTFGHGSGTGSGIAGGVITPATKKGTSMHGTGKVTGGNLDVEKAGRAVCSTFSKLHECFNAYAKEKTTLKGEAILTLSIATDGHVDKVTTSGTLSDATLAACIEPEVKAATLPPPNGGAPATFEYTIDYERAPGSGSVHMLETGVTVTGSLPPEVVRRIVRANFPRLRMCYELASKKDPTLAGTVFVDFVIDTTGAIESAKLGTGTLTDASTPPCVLGVMKTLAFPEPEKGKVNVHYGVDFSHW